MKRTLKILTLVITLFTVTQTAGAVSFALDSIAEWGRFPRFCVGVYRWGDKFFNSYDSAYVVGTGYKFNIKFKTESWSDTYNFYLPNDLKMYMLSDPSTTVGLHLTYMAVSAGYDINVSNLITGNRLTRQRFNFGFNCSLFAAEWSYVNNDVGTKIKRFGRPNAVQHLDMPFDGISTSSWHLDTYYFFNHKRYSQAAAFNFSKVQKRSQGSFYAGLSFANSKYDFDFSGLPRSMREELPENWIGYHYQVATDDYAFRLGYGYNWVFARHWVLGVTESPIIGLRHGSINSEMKRNSFALTNRAALSVVWNNKRWFAGVIGRMDANLVYDKDHTMATAVLSIEASVGYRFNLW